MNKLLPLAITFAAVLIARASAGPDYQAVPNWLKLPPGMQQLGSQHGDVAVSSKGHVYVSTMDPANGVLVFASDGKFLRKLSDAPNDFHGFVIHNDKGGEFIYGPRLNEQSIVKLSLDGKTVLKIQPSAVPDKYKTITPDTMKDEQGKMVSNPNAGKPFLRLTGMDVAPNGDLYVTDGYASDYVHRFDRNGKYLASFGGKQPPYSFKTLHKIAIDTRFSPARIIGTDRANGRIVHMSLEGEFLGVVASDLLLPAAVAIHGDYAVIGELKGQVTFLDKSGKVVARVGTNTAADEVATNVTEPAKWRQGIVTAPHGVAFNSRGDLFVSEYSKFGRVHRYTLK